MFVDIVRGVFISVWSDQRLGVFVALRLHSPLVPLAQDDAP